MRELLSWSRCQEQNREGEGRESESGKEGKAAINGEDEVEGIAASSP
jgi:hypothetical protein